MDASTMLPVPNGREHTEEQCRQSGGSPDRSVRMTSPDAAGRGGPARVMLPKSLTGVDGFDEITEGGLPTGRPTLVCGPAGSGKSLFALQFLVNGATRYGEPGVFLTFEEPRDDLVVNTSSLGLDLAGLERDGKLLIDVVTLQPETIVEN